MKYNKTQLLKMPERKDENSERLYNSVLVIPTKLKHESGYARIALIGQWVDGNKKTRFEICSYPDDISWISPDTLSHIRTDCYHPQSVLHFWGHGKFKIEGFYSSCKVEFLPDNAIEH